MTTNPPNQEKKVFISCPAGTNLDILTEILTEHDIRVVNFENSFEAGSSILESSAKMIESADLIFAFVQDDTNANTMFELGYAVKAGKKIVIIGDANTPIFLNNVVHLKANIDDEKAFKFQLKTLLGNLDLITPFIVDKKLRPLTNSPNRKKSVFISYNNQRVNDVEKRLQTAFENAAEIEALVAEQNLGDSNSYRPDFAARLSNVTDFSLGSLVIEIKSTTRENIPKVWINKLVDYTLHLKKGAAGLLVVDGPRKINLKTVSFSPLVFAIDLEELEILLANGQLANNLRLVRNKFAHSATNHA